MKKSLFVLSLMLLTMGMSLTVVSCSSDDNEDFVQEAAATEEVKTFFEKDCNIITENLVGGFFTAEDYMGVVNGDGVIPPSLVKILAIHSQEELESVYKGALKLPQIDFNQHVLLVGLTYNVSGQESLGKVRLLHGQGNSYELQVIMYWNTNTNIGHLQMERPVLFWALYPKFSTSHMNVVRRVEEVWSDYQE